MRGPAFTALRLPEDFRPPGPAGQAEVPTRVRDLFLGPRHLGQYVELLESVLSRDA